LLGLVAGCGSSSAGHQDKKETAVRETFAKLQAALKAKDANKIWDLLDADSRADADRAAKAMRDTYQKAGATEKAQQEKALGLPGAELSELTGKGFLKTKRFLGKYDEIPESRVEKVVVKEDNATVHYVEDDGDKEKLTFTRHDGRWHVVLAMPRGT
jgi:hypothetical protein